VLTRRHFAFLTTPRWIALTLTCLLLLPLFHALSEWQWRRLHQRQAFNALVSRNLAADPIPAAQLLRPNGVTLAALPADLQWRQLSMCGTWQPRQQVLVRRKSLDAQAGFWVATPLSSADVTLVVVRGWLPAGTSSRDTPKVVPPPTGNVCIEARLRIAPTRTRPEPTDLPPGQVDLLEPAAIAADAFAAGYGELVASNPESTTGLTLWPAPELSEGPHRSYAIQWLVFAVMTIIGWGVLVRGELQQQGRQH
jgi:cytochrome oxidase assembly protein ShyY1